MQVLAIAKMPGFLGADLTLVKRNHGFWAMVKFPW